MPSPRHEFYPPELIGRSRSVLDRVREAVPDAILIGGWASWVRTGGAMSHDIDLIVTRPQLTAIKTLAGELSESRQIAGRKWSATVDSIHLDLYVPYESRLGQHLELRVERLVDRRERVDTWSVLDLPAHLATKLAALLDRPDSTPGDKDRQEIMALLDLGVEPTAGVGIVHQASARTPEEIHQHISQAFRYLGDVSLDRRGHRRLTHQAAEWNAASQRLIEERAPDRSGPNHRPRGPQLPGPTLGR